MAAIRPRPTHRFHFAFLSPLVLRVLCSVGRATLPSAALVVPSVSFAAEPTAADRAEAKKVYTEARKLRKDGKFGEALVLFRRAHELAPTPVTRLDFAKALVDTGKLLNARELSRTVADMPVSSSETSKSKLARKEAVALSAELDQRIAVVVLTIERELEQEVTIDGAIVSKELRTAGVEFDPGEHVVVVQMGEHRFETRFTAAERDRKAQILSWSPAEVPPTPPHPAPLLPEVPQVIAPQLPPVLPPQLPPAETQATVEDADGITPAVPVLLTLGGASLAGGVIAGAVALSQASALLAACNPSGGCPPTAQPLYGTHQATAVASEALLAVGGIAAGAGIVVWIIDAATSQEPSPAGPQPVGKVSFVWSGTNVAISGTW